MAFIVSKIFINSVAICIKPIRLSNHIYSTIRSPLGHVGRFILQLKPTPYSYLRFKKKNGTLLDPFTDASLDPLNTLFCPPWIEWGDFLCACAPLFCSNNVMTIMSLPLSAFSVLIKRHWWTVIKSIIFHLIIADLYFCRLMSCQFEEHCIVWMFLHPTPHWLY